MMMKNLLLSCLLLLAAVRLFAADAPAPGKKESPLAPLASLVGGLWVGHDVAPAKEGPALKIELRFAWAENRQAIRFDSSFVQGDKHAPYTSGLYGWNGGKGKIAIFYTDSSGSLTEGLITREGENVFVNDLVVTEPGGKAYPVQVRLTKVDADTFDNAIFLQKDGAWAPLVTVRYERQK